MTFLDEMNRLLARTGHWLDTWSPGDTLGTRYRICRTGFDYSSALWSSCTACGKKDARLMVTAFVAGFFATRPATVAPEDMTA